MTYFDIYTYICKIKIEMINKSLQIFKFTHQLLYEIIFGKNYIYWRCIHGFVVIYSYKNFVLIISLRTHQNYSSIFPCSCRSVKLDVSQCIFSNIGRSRCIAGKLHVWRTHEGRPISRPRRWAMGCCSRVSNLDGRGYNILLRKPTECLI